MNLKTGYSFKSVEARLPHVTVGVDAGMFRGADHFAIQSAVHYVAGMGGGQVEILPGRYELRNTIFLPDGVTLRGSGEQTTLVKAPSQTIALAEDCDGCRWYVDFERSAGFSVGDGITISSDAIDGAQGQQFTIHTIVAIESNRIYLDSLPGQAHWVAENAVVSSVHSMLEIRDAQNVVISDISLLGNHEQNAWLDGNYGAGIFMRRAENVVVRNIEIADFHGDGVSWQTSHDVTLENCNVHDVTGTAFHPGNGSQRPIMRGNTIRSCKSGIYFCWDVNGGIAENNHISHCATPGISLGHRDTGNIVRGNEIVECGEAGIFFQPTRSAERTAHRNCVEKNTVRCRANAAGISVARGVEDAVLRHNTIVVGEANRDQAIVIDEAALRTVVENNEIIFEPVNEIPNRKG